MVVRAVKIDGIDSNGLKSTFIMKQKELHAVGEKDRYQDSNGNWIKNNSTSFLENDTKIEGNSKRNQDFVEQIQQGVIAADQGQCESPLISTNQSESAKSFSPGIIPPISYLDQYIDEAAKLTTSSDYQSNYRNNNQESSDIVSSHQYLRPDSTHNNPGGHHPSSFTFHLQNQHQQHQPNSSRSIPFQRIQDECRIDPSFIHTLTHPNQSDLSLPQYPPPPSHQQLKPDIKKRGSKVTLRPDGTKRYECHFKGCGRSFSTSGHLTRHFKIHTGEKSHACHILHCPSVFSRKDNMIQHFIAHQKKLVAMNAPVLLKSVSEGGGNENQSLENGKQVVKPKKRDRSTICNQMKKSDSSTTAKPGDMNRLFWHGGKKGEVAASNQTTTYRDPILPKSTILGSTASSNSTNHHGNSNTNLYSTLHHPQPFFANQTMYQNYASNRFQPCSMYMYQDPQSYQSDDQQLNYFIRPRSSTISQHVYSSNPSLQNSQNTSCLSAPPCLYPNDGNFRATQQSIGSAGNGNGNEGGNGGFRPESTPAPATLYDPNQQPHQEYGGPYPYTNSFPTPTTYENNSTFLSYDGSIGSGLSKEWRHEHSLSFINDHKIDPYPSIQQSCTNPTTTSSNATPSLGVSSLFSISGLGQMSSPMFSPLVDGFVMHSSKNPGSTFISNPPLLDE